MADNSLLIDYLRFFRSWLTLPKSAKQAFRRDRKGKIGDDPGIDQAVSETIEWLARAQEFSATGDGGVARHYSVIDGWGPSYPETTGYIVPTMLAYAKSHENKALMDRTRRMLDWLVDIQLDGGGFQGGTVNDRPVVPVVFNTGQILIGLSAGSVEFDAPYTDSMHRAAQWLLDIQDDDGCWHKYHSPFARSGDKTYDTHTAWGLIEAARASGNSEYGDAALRNIRWALGKQKDNGWFDDCCLTDPNYPLTHTLGYTLKGIIEGYLYSGDSDLLAAAMLTGKGLLSTVRPDGSIPGLLDRDFQAAAPWVCMTGSAQIAGCWLQLYQQTSDTSFLDAARTVNAYLRRRVSVDGPAERRGAVRGSYPINGDYGQYQYLNWAAKFFIDSNLLEKSIQGLET
jgi:hypothetical protein